jgi:hypothetical protein
MSGNIIEVAMTAKEQLLQEVPGWSEDDAKIALRAVQWAHSGVTDEWGGTLQISRGRVRGDDEAIG